MSLPASASGHESPRLSELLASLSLGLDLAEGQPMGHALRTCLTGMRLVRRLGLPVGDLRHLYFTLLLQNAGGPGSGASVYAAIRGDDRVALRDLHRLDWSCDLQALAWALRHAHPNEPWPRRLERVARRIPGGRVAVDELFRARAARATTLVQRLGLGPRVTEAVHAANEHWDGSGQPRGMDGGAIPLAARVALLARSLDTATTAGGPSRALTLARERSGRWFDPMLVSECLGMAEDLARWQGMDEPALRAAVREAEPGSASLLAGPATIHRAAAAFAEAIDAHSPWRAGHSTRVADRCTAIAERLDWDGASAAVLRRAALLHDIGILSVGSRLLDTPDPLSAEDWEAVRLHPYYSRRILEPIPGFEEVAAIAGAHHERLDGRGYFRGLRGGQLSPGARALAVADIYDALTTSRSFRGALEPDDALALMARDRGVGLDPDCVDALADAVRSGPEGDGGLEPLVMPERTIRPEVVPAETSDDDPGEGEEIARAA